MGESFPSLITFKSFKCKYWPDKLIYSFTELVCSLSSPNTEISQLEADRSGTGPTRTTADPEQHKDPPLWARTFLVNEETKWTWWKVLVPLHLEHSQNLRAVGFCWVLSGRPGLSVFLGPISGRQDDNSSCRRDNGHGSQLEPWNPVSVQPSERRIQLQILISGRLHPAARLHPRSPLPPVSEPDLWVSVSLCDWQTVSLMCWFIIHLLTWQLIFHSVHKHAPPHPHTRCFIKADSVLVSLKHLLFSSDSVLEADGTLCLYCYILLASC